MRRVALLSLLLCLILPPSAHAAFPGQNGQIAFNNHDLFVVNPDGSGLRQLPGGGGYPAWTSDGKYLGFGANSYASWMDALGGPVHQITNTFQQYGIFNPTWSPDARSIAFATCCGGAIVVAHLGESIDTNRSIGTCPGPSSCQFDTPAWSPDGTKIAYSVIFSGGNTDIHVSNPDGSGDRQLTSGPAQELNPDWSPDGQRIAYDVENGVTGEPNGIYTMKADGSDVQAIPGTQSDQDPAWSPDGTKLVVRSAPGVTDAIVTMNADGSNRTTVTAPGAAPDWGPVRAPTPPLYARPKGATPYQTYLVPAYKSCDAPNEQHGAPLSADSCSPPQQLSDFLTVGTLDANGQPAKFIGSVRFDVVPGNPNTTQNEADVKMKANLTDVRCKATYPTCEGGPLADYGGSLQAAFTVRITDRYNGPPHPAYDAGTLQTVFYPLRFKIPCTATSDTTVGSTCSLSTTFNSLVPDIVREDYRSIWELGQVIVTDGGPDGATFDQATIFAVGGIFVP